MISIKNHRILAELKLITHDRFMNASLYYLRKGDYEI